MKTSVDANEFYDALNKANLEYSALSWDGFNLFGDKKSIEEAERLQYFAGLVPFLRLRIKDLEAALTAASASRSG